MSIACKWPALYWTQEDLVDLGVTQLAGDFEGFEQEQVLFTVSPDIAATTSRPPSI